MACESDGGGLPGSEANIYFPSGQPFLTSLDSCKTENANFLVVLPAFKLLDFNSNLESSVPVGPHVLSV